MRRFPPSRTSAFIILALAATVAVAASPIRKADAAVRKSPPPRVDLEPGRDDLEPLNLDPEASRDGLQPDAPEPDGGALASADEALRALGARVTRSSHSDALRTTFRAYYSYRAANPDAVRKPYLYYVDMGLDNRTARGWVFDMDSHTVVDGPFAVAHGRGSAKTRDGVPVRFSNRPGSNATSLGLYLAQETYSFNGKLSGRRYSSVGLRMRGESGSFNGAARQRGIVAHGAPYVTAGQAGRSEGCPAMEMTRAQRLLPLIANGGVVFIYSPNDDHWLRNDPWVAAD